FVLLDIRKARLAAGGAAAGPQANQAVYQGNAPAMAQRAQGEGPLVVGPAPPTVPPTQPQAGNLPQPGGNRGGEAGPQTQGMQIAHQAEAALKQGDANRARELFKQAMSMQNELDGPTRQLVM